MTKLTPQNIKASQQLPAILQEFINYCIAQPADRPIDHSEGWEECAVGDYARANNSNREVEAVVDDVWDALCDYANDFRLWLGNANRYKGTDESVDTYGDLVRQIIARYPQFVTSV